MVDVPEMADNAGNVFKKLVKDILDYDAVAEDLLGKNAAKRREKLQDYLGKVDDPELVLDNLIRILATTDLPAIRKLASLLDPEHSSSIPPELDAPI